MIKNGQKKILLYVFVLIVVTFMPLAINNKMFQHTLVLVMLWAGLAMSWNLVGGMVGQVSLGHSAFFGIGAYVSTICYIYFKVSPWLGMVLGGIISVLFAILISYWTLRLKGIFFSMVTIAFAETVLRVILLVCEKAGVPYGINIPYRPSVLNMTFDSQLGYIYVGLLYLLIILFISSKIKYSKMGYYFSAIKESEDAALAVGIRVRKYKVFAMAISAFFTSLGGTFYAQYLLYVDTASVFDIGNIGIQMALLAIVGGSGFVFGPIIGALLIVPLRELVLTYFGGSFQGLHLVLYGFILILMVTYWEDGLAKLLVNVRYFSRRQINESFRS